MNMRTVMSVNLTSRSYLFIKNGFTFRQKSVRDPTIEARALISKGFEPIFKDCYLPLNPSANPA